MGARRRVGQRGIFPRLLILIFSFWGWTGFVKAQEAGPGFRLIGSPGMTIPVMASKMTNLVFPIPVAAGVKVSRDVLAQKPKGVENVIELKAIRRNFVPTNLSVYGTDGRLYSFELRFVEDTSVLNYRVVPEKVGPGGLGAVDSGHPIQLTGWPVDGATLNRDAVLLSGMRGFLHRSVRVSGLRLRLKGVYMRDSLMWLSLRVSNRTKISFRLASLRIYIDDGKQLKRTASQQLPVRSVYPGVLAAVPGRAVRSFAVGLDPLAAGRGKRVVVELADADGGRTLVLKVKGRVLLKARE